MFTKGRVVIKIAGRDANTKAVIVEELQKGFVMIEGEGRKKKRKVNVRHLEPLMESLDVTSLSTHEEICNALR